jgi:hypothetical protein
MKKIISILSITLMIFSTACKEYPGEGGNSTIRGYVWGKKYNSSYTNVISEGPGSDVNVYIIYGNETSYGNKIASSPDGSFEFKYLRPGTYKIYVYSKNSTTVNPAGKSAVTVDVDLPKKGTTDVGIITVNI